MMRPLNIALVLGTRPEAIKLAPVYLEMARRREEFSPKLWVTAQHRELLDQVLQAFKLRPDRDFAIMQPGQTLTTTTSRVLEALERTFNVERPDAILVQGDTTTAFAGALAAYYARVPVGHIEAGLRTDNKFAPYPEEMNRRLATRLSDYHFAPTTLAQKNLVCEGVAEDRIWITGNTVIDALDYVVEDARAKMPALPIDFPLNELNDGRRMVLITGHRRESFGAGFESICQAIAELAARFADVLFVYPVHLNPNVREPVQRLLRGAENIFLVDPLSYYAFVWAMDRCYFLLSDSGGVQEEAPHLGKPVLVMRDTTERPEALEAGTSKLVGTDRVTIVREAASLLEDAQAYAKMSGATNPFGDGHAAARIAEILIKELSR